MNDCKCETAQSFCYEPNLLFKSLGYYIRDVYMPVEVNLLEGSGVEIMATGLVYGHEIINANKEIINNESLGNIQYQLIDKSACTEYSVTADDINKIAKLNSLIAKANPNIIMAIVESKTLQFSLTELWQTIVKKYNFENSSF